MNSILKCVEVQKSFGENQDKNFVLKGVSIDIEQGEFVSVMGPSGSGKSTLLFALSGMDHIESGTILYGSDEIAGMKENQRADFLRDEIGFVFQQPTLLKNLNIFDNIILPSMRNPGSDKKILMSKAAELMKMTGIDGLQKRNITQASGGQLQRAGICRALIKNPRIIFADEPTGALDSRSAREIMEIFSEINDKGTTILIVTHDAKIAAGTDRICFMKDGRIIDELKLKELPAQEHEERVKSIRNCLQKHGM